MNIKMLKNLQFFDALGKVIKDNFFMYVHDTYRKKHISDKK